MDTSDDDRAWFNRGAFGLAGQLRVNGPNGDPRVAALSGQFFAVFTASASFVGLGKHNTTDPRLWATAETVAERAGVSVSTVRRAWQRLRADGLIEHTGKRRVGRDGRAGPVIYRLTAIRESYAQLAAVKAKSRAVSRTDQDTGRAVRETDQAETRVVSRADERVVSRADERVVSQTDEVLGSGRNQREPKETKTLESQVSARAATDQRSANRTTAARPDPAAAYRERAQQARRQEYEQLRRRDLAWVERVRAEVATERDVTSPPPSAAPEVPWGHPDWKPW